VFKRVAEQVLAYRNVPHDIALPSGALRASHAVQTQPERDELADFAPGQVESPVADVAAEQSWPPASPPGAPVANSTIAPGAPPVTGVTTSQTTPTGLPTVELPEGKAVEMPNLVGKSVREVIQICMQLGINPVLAGSGIVQEQQPGAGAMVRRGGLITVRFGRRAELAQFRVSKQTK